MACEPRTHNDYTVALVCALPKEQTAAIAMLDERHEDLPNPVNDHNAYTLGSMSNHDVVIACLPKGEIGTSSAASVATRLTSTFPSIRFGLMVGIGGGVPPSVRLGDVVVSSPVDGFSGVIQWDMGKAEENNSFRRTGALNNPPSSLLTALTRLESKHDLEGSSISQYLEDMNARYPRLAQKYGRSEQLEDLCFEADYNHVTSASGHHTLSNVGRKRDHNGLILGQDRHDCRHCDRRRILTRPPRDMAVHYGLIASGNQVIKDAIFRDQINTRLGGRVLCFEMEAAGLMNSFPCVVVRGICDYSDSHKSKDWQEHAAAVAAAFAKELLSVVAPARVAESPTAVKVMQTVSDTVNKIRDDVVSVQQDVHTLKSNEEGQNRETLRRWLSPIDYEAIQSDIYRNHQEGTGEWFPNHVRFTTWVSSSSSQTLICPGIPGAGKTTMMSIVINHLRSKFLHDPGTYRVKTGLAFLYCTHGRQSDQQCDDLLGSLLSQLSLEQDVVPPSIQKLYKQHRHGRGRASRREITTELRATVAQYSTIFIVIDALDECEDNTTRKRLLAELLELQQISNIRLMLTFRPHIELNLRNAAQLPVRADEQDVQRYLTGQLGCLSRVVERDQTLQHDILGRIPKAADGIFLLAQLYMGSLKGKHTKKAICEELDRMGTGHTGLTQAYDGAFQRIESDLSRTLISWVLCARRMLTVNELRHALAIEPNTSRLDLANICDLQEVVSGCAGLVVLDTLSQSIRLVHNTAKEYFQREVSKLFPDAETNIGRSCLTYLSYDVFKTGRCLSAESLTERVLDYPLYDYASQHWAHHAQDQAGDVKSLALAFLLDNDLVSATSDWLWISGFGIKTRKQRFPASLGGMHLAAYFGLHDHMLELANQVPVDTTDSYQRTPLIYAAVRGHTSTVARLLDSAADVNFRDSYGGTALHYAALQGSNDVVALLIKNGADINSRDIYGGTPLTWAIEGASEAIVKRILRHRPITEIFYAPFARHGYGDLPTQVRRIIWPKHEGESLDDPLQASSSACYFEGQLEQEDISPRRFERRVFLPPKIKSQIDVGNQQLERDSLFFILRDSPQDNLHGNIHHMAWRCDWTVDDIFFTPLLRAVWTRNHCAVLLLLKHGCCPHFGNSRGLTPLLMAERLGDATSSAMLAAFCHRSGWFYASDTGLWEN
ncbi:uncharacterized protein BDV17DRAFT_67832 [Aspergillus undulatus]|uniref:uncharacterized protein n=1 Tax=Aspergillus undulatus TaxID=1810928 RepID=UPI003CCE00DD